MSDQPRCPHLTPRGWVLTLTAIYLVLLLFPPWANGQDLGATVWGDLSYLGLTLWDDAKTIALAPLEIGKVREVTPEQLLIATLVVGSVGGMIGLDSQDSRRGQRASIDGAALALGRVGFGLLGVVWSLFTGPGGGRTTSRSDTPP